MATRTRDWRFEALRLLSMFFIVATHFSVALFADQRLGAGIFHAVSGGWKAAAEGSLSMFGQTGVTIFVLISAWFLTLSHRSPKGRFVRLWLYVVFYSVGIWIVMAIITPLLHLSEPIYSVRTVLSVAFPLLFRQYWFMTAFAVMILAGPFLNMLLDHLTQRQTLLLIAGTFFVVFLWPLINPASYYFTDPLYLITLYLIGSYCRRYSESIPRISGLTAVLISCACYLVCVAGSRLVATPGARNLGYAGNLFSSGPGAVPFLGVISGIAIFLWVAQKTVKPANPGIIGRIVNFLSPATLGIYLLHENWMIKPYWWQAVLSYPRPATALGEIGAAMLALILSYLILTVVSLLLTKLVVAPVTHAVSHKILA